MQKFNLKDNKIKAIFYEKLKEIISLDENTLKLMGMEGRKNVLKKFDVEKMCNSTITEYKKLIG